MLMVGEWEKEGDKKQPWFIHRANGQPTSLSGMQHLKDISALEVAEITYRVKSEGHNRMAQIVRLVITVVFEEAQHSGHVPPGLNPALATRQPRNKVTRQHLSIDEWKSIYEHAEQQQPYLQCGMLLALVTG